MKARNSSIISEGGDRMEKSARGIRIVGAMLLLAFSSQAFTANETGAFAALTKAERASLDDVERRTFNYFADSTNPANGLAPDHWPKNNQSSGDYFASIAAVGFALTAYGIGVERGWMPRKEAANRTLATLRFFHNAEMGDGTGVTGNHGFFYHFLEMDTGKRYKSRAWDELSSLDTAELMAGALFSMSFFDGNSKVEHEIRTLAEDLYSNVDWPWFFGGTGDLIEGGWTPEHGFDSNYYRGYHEGFIVYILALGSPTHPVSSESYERWTETYDKTWGEFQGQEHLGGGPLFWHQYAQMWIDFRGIQDAYMQKKGIDYFTNSQRAALSQREYAIHNPLGWVGYGPQLWGLTASNGPKGSTKQGDPDRYKSDSKSFYGYIARGAGLGYSIDDGTIAPTAAISSIAFAPEIVLPVINELKSHYGNAIYTRYGFLDAINPSFNFLDRPLRTGRVIPNVGWVDDLYIGIDQGPILGMIENYRSEFVWNVMKKNPFVRHALIQAGFKGGWLDPDVVRKNSLRPG
jgi:hypothetical protein